MFKYSELVDKRAPDGQPTPCNDVLTLVAQHAIVSQKPVLIRVKADNSYVDQVWYRKGDIWCTKTFSRYRYPLSCPTCKDSSSHFSGCDDNDEICYHCQGASII